VRYLQTPFGKLFINGHEFHDVANEKVESFGFSKDDIGVGLFESITLGLYREAGDVLREYVSNEIDNDPPPSSVGVRINSASRTVVIEGDGPGMTWDEFRNAVKVGVSFKDPRVNVGFRGIGIWAGAAACATLRVATKSDDDDNEYELFVDCEKLRSYFSGPNRNTPLIDVLNRCAGYKKRPSRRAPGTEVTLEGIRTEFEELLSEGKVRDYLTRECPLAFEDGFRHANSVDKFLRSSLPVYRRVKMRINGAPVRGLHLPSDLREPIMGTLAAPLGTSRKRATLGHYWICHAKRTEKFESGFDSGLRIRIKNFTVSQPGTLHNQIWKKAGMKNEHILGYWVGEIHTRHLELRPNAERNDLEPSLAREQLLELASELFADTMVPFSRLLSDYYRLDDLVKRASTESTTIRQSDYEDKTVFDLDQERRRLGDRIQDLRSRRDDLSLKLKKNLRKVPGLVTIKKELDTGLGPKTERVIKRLQAKLRKLDGIFEQKKLGMTAKPPAPAETERPEEAIPAKASTGMGKEETIEKARKPVTMPLSPALATLVEEAASRLVSFEQDSRKLVRALLIALVESGVCNTEQELSDLVDAWIRISQRRG